MPVSRKRKLTRGQKIKGAVRRMETFIANRSAVLPIYARALPGHQLYPPFVWLALKREPRRETKVVELAERRAPGSVVTLGNREYKVGRDGAWRRVELQKEAA